MLADMVGRLSIAVLWAGGKDARRARRWTTVTCALLALLAFTGSAARAEGPNAIITSSGCQATELAANDDGSSPEVTLPFTINFFGGSFSSLWVNNNGNVTFTGPLATYTPQPILSEQTPIIAPFWADVDTRGSGSGTTHYGDISVGDTQVGGHQAFCVNWVNVGYFASGADKLNSFQLVLIDRSDTGANNFDIEFNYDKVQWETGDASGGIDGLGGSSARAGYSNGSTTSFELPGSAVNGAFLDSNTTSGLIYNNIGSPLQEGRYIFPVRNGVATGHSISGHIYANDTSHPLGGAFVQACPTPSDTPCRLGSSAADGSYAFTNLPDHTSGTGVLDHDWSLVVNPPGGSNVNSATAGPVTVDGSDVTGVDVVLHGPAPLPSGASVSSVSFGTESSGIPTVFWGEPFTVTVQGCASGTGTATLTVHEDGFTDAESLVESPVGSGTYTATFPAVSPHHGSASIAWTLSCGTTGGFDLYIDPSGVVKDTGGNPVAGATVTLYRSDDPGGPFVPVPDGSAIMSPGNQTNPDTTGATGGFGWDVVAGYYKVRAEKTGCTAPSGGGDYVESDVLTIPPPATGLVLTLDCPAVTDESISASGTTIAATEGASFSGSVATFTDPDTSATAGEYSATIDWGDGSPTDTGTIGGSGGAFSVDGTHTYAEEGPYTATVTITDVDNASNTATANSNTTVADAALHAGTLTLPSSTTLGNPTDLSFSFTDDNAAAPAGDFTTTIDWGDGSGTDTGTLSGSGGSYTVDGSHSYGAAGPYDVTITIADVGGSTTATQGSTTVVAPSGSAMATKQQVLDELNAAVASAARKQDADRLQHAADSLSKSLDSSLWNGQNDLQANGGEKVFDREKDAVGKLTELLKDKHSLITAGTLQDWIDTLESVDQALAQTAIDDANTAGGDQKKLGDATKEMTKAADELAKGHYPQAIDHYKNAWKHAEESLKTPPHPPPH